MPLPRDCTSTELAVLLGVTTQTISALTKTGVLRQTARGRYDLAPSVQGHWRFKELSATKRASKGSPFDAAKLRKMQADACIAEMTVHEREGSLLPVDAAIQIVAKVLGSIKQRLLALPARLTPRVFHAKAEAEMQQILKREMAGILAAADALIVDAGSKLRSGGQPRTNGDAQEDRASV
jgi:hypothetical protein